MAAPDPAADAPDYRDRFEQLTGRSLRACPSCGTGQMLVAGSFAPGHDPPALEDTS